MNGRRRAAWSVGPEAVRRLWWWPEWFLGSDGGNSSARGEARQREKCQTQTYTALRAVHEIPPETSSNDGCHHADDEEVLWRNGCPAVRGNVQHVLLAVHDRVPPSCRPSQCSSRVTGGLLKVTNTDDNAHDEVAEVNDLISRNLRRYRTDRGMSLGELARRSGLSKQTVSKVEQGAGNPTVETLSLLGRALGVPARRMLTEWGTPVFVQRRRRRLVGLRCRSRAIAR